MNRSVGPLIAAVILLLPMLYVASYLALVVPGPMLDARYEDGRFQVAALNHYRGASQFADRFYWPLEQLDRRLRPAAWDSQDVTYY